jgi:hypothetical protein
MNTNTAFLLALLASWGFLSYSAWRLAARRGLFRPMVDLCALLCPVILVLHRGDAPNWIYETRGLSDVLPTRLCRARGKSRLGRERRG